MDQQRIGARHTMCRYLLLCFLLSTVPARAGNTAYEINGGVGQSDNVTRVESDPIDETVASAGVRFSYDERGARVEADVVGNLAYVDYLDNTYDTELLGNVAANARAAIVPEAFFWVLSENFGQVLNDPFTPATPENRENINYLSTGPEVDFAFGAQTQLQLGARYALSDYQDSPLDSESALGEAGLIRAMSKGSSLGLFVRQQQLEYDTAPAGSNFDQTQAFLRYDALGARTHLRADLGQDEINRDGAGGTQGGLLIRLDVERRMASHSTLTLHAARQFDSSGSAFASEQADGGLALDTSASRQTFDPFLNERLQLGWSFSGSRTDVDLGANWSRQTYEERPEFDQTLTSFSASARHALTPVLSLRVGLSQSASKFEQGAADYDDRSANLSLEWRLSRVLITRLLYSSGKRDSDALQGDYTENRIWLTIGYGHGDPRDRMRGREFAVDAAAGAE